MKHNLPSLKALHAIETVGRHRTITSAAEELNVSPGAVSRHVKLLEEYLGCNLFARHANGLALTEVGRRYVAHLSDAFSLIDQACAEILRDGENTDLTICAIGTFGTEWLLPRITQFEHEYPNIKVSIRMKLRGVNFDTEEAHVGIIASRHKPRRVESVKLYTPLVTPIVSPQLLDHAPAICSVSDLQRFKLLHAINARPTWVQWLSKVAPDNGVDTSAGIWLERSTQMHHAVRQGVGVGLGQFFLVGDELISGSLIAPFDQLYPAPGSIYLVWPERLKNRPEIASFRDWLTAVIATGNAKLAHELSRYRRIDA